jgi:hypothetical protein
MKTVTVMEGSQRLGTVDLFLGQNADDSLTEWSRFKNERFTE